MLAASTFMKQIVILFVTLLLSCARTIDDKSQGDFDRYLSSLEELKTPLKFNCKGGVGIRSNNYDTALWQKYKYRGSTWPCGRMFSKDSIIMTVEVGLGDFLWPLLMTFDRAGHKLDSLSVYQRSGMDMGYESCEYVTITDKQEIVVTDSTTRWDINKAGDDVVEGTQKVTVDTVIYKIDIHGRFKRIRG